MRKKDKILNEEEIIEFIKSENRTSMVDNSTREILRKIKENGSIKVIKKF